MKNKVYNWPNINFDLSKIQLTENDTDIFVDLSKQLNPKVPPDLLKELFDYYCYEARSARIREDGAPLL